MPDVTVQFHPGRSSIPVAVELSREIDALGGDWNAELATTPGVVEYRGVPAEFLPELANSIKVIVTWEGVAATFLAANFALIGAVKNLLNRNPRTSEGERRTVPIVDRNGRTLVVVAVDDDE